MSLLIDLFPDLSEEELFKKLETLLHAHAKKLLGTILDFMMSKSLAEVLCRELGLDQHTKAAEVSKKDMRRVVTWLKSIPLTIIGRGAGDEFVTAGGVALSEVDPRTMESKISPGCFFAGEILDIDGFTGGFNLQASWATGRTAGEHAAS